MPSFWEHKSNPKDQHMLTVNRNDSLPCLITKTNECLFRNKQSRTFHDNRHSDQTNQHDSTQKSKQSQSFHRSIFNKKQTIQSKSTYHLTRKNKIEDSPIIDFTQAIKKIQDVLNRQCNFSCVHSSKLKLKKTLSTKTFFVKHNDVQNLPQSLSLSKQQVKRQLQQIFRVFTLPCSQSKANLKNVQKDESTIQSQKKHTFLLSRSKTIERENPDNQQNLSQKDRLLLIKQSKAFEKVQKHLLLKSYSTKILYHHLIAQLYIESGQLENALDSLYFCEYNARKVDFDQYVIPCLILQSQIKQSLYEFDEAINLLKTALEFSVVKKWKQLELRLLEKISMVYYYRGNSYMAKYYKEMSEVGLPKNESDIYVKEYSKNQELKTLEAKIFSLPFDTMNKKKHNNNYQVDISRDLFQDHEKLIHSHHEEVSSMLRNSKTSKIGIKFRKLILQNAEKAQVKRYDSASHSPEILPRFVAFQYPIQNCSQIIKSHLSRSRFGLGSQIKNIHFLKSLKLMKSIYLRLGDQLHTKNDEQCSFNKENFPYHNQ